MNSLEHFIIGDQKNSPSFLDLTKKSENLDKYDFLETGYFVDDSIFERKYRKGSTSTRRGKEKVALEDDEPLHMEPVVNLDCDDDGDLRWTQEDIHMTPGSTSVPNRDDIRVSLASSAYRLCTPHDSPRVSQKCKHDSADEIASERQWVLEVLKRNKEENERIRQEMRETCMELREESRKAREDNIAMIKALVESILVQIASIVHSRPIAMIEPSAHSTPLMITDKAHTSSGSDVPFTRGVSTASQASMPTDPSASSGHVAEASTRRRNISSEDKMDEDRVPRQSDALQSPDTVNDGPLGFSL